MKNYSQDPYWLTARFNSTCACGKPIAKGQRIFYYPKGKVALCPTCSPTASAEFQNACDDERFMTSGMDADSDFSSGW